MTHRQRILDACRGKIPERIPWVPRLEVWHRANSAAGALPSEFHGLSLRQIVDALGLAYHAVVHDTTPANASWERMLKATTAASARQLPDWLRGQDSNLEPSG